VTGAARAAMILVRGAEGIIDAQEIPLRRLTSKMFSRHYLRD
jgi:hypothetical protein